MIKYKVGNDKNSENARRHKSNIWKLESRGTWSYWLGVPGKMNPKPTVWKAENSYYIFILCTLPKTPEFTLIITSGNWSESRAIKADWKISLRCWQPATFPSHSCNWALALHPECDLGFWIGTNWGFLDWRTADQAESWGPYRKEGVNKSARSDCWVPKLSSSFAPWMLAARQETERIFSQ